MFTKTFKLVTRAADIPCESGTEALNLVRQSLTWLTEKTVYDRLITCKKTNENRNFQRHIPIFWQTPHNLHASTNFKHELQIKWRFVWTPCLPDLGINVRVRDHSERQILTVTASVEYGQFSSFPSERSPQTPYIAHLPNPCSLDLQKRCMCLCEDMCHVRNPMPV